MNKHSRTVLIIGVGLFAFLVSGTYFILRPKVLVSHTSLAYDPNDVDAVAGYFSDIFVGRVIKKNGTENSGRVATLYSVQIVRSLKGDAKGEVAVRQFGGYRYGQWTIVNGDVGRVVTDVDEKKLEEFFLQPNKTYLFVASRSEDQGRYTIGWTEKTIQPLAVDSGVTEAEAYQIISEDPRVKEMEAVLANQAVKRTEE